MIHVPKKVWVVISQTDGMWAYESHADAKKEYRANAALSKRYGLNPPLLLQYSRGKNRVAPDADVPKELSELWLVFDDRRDEIYIFPTETDAAAERRDIVLEPDAREDTISEPVQYVLEKQER